MGHLQNKIQQRFELPRLSIPDGDVTTYTRKLIIQEALTWLHTPFKHQGRVKGVGGDCIAVFIGVGRKFGYDKLVGFTDVKNYGRMPDTVFMRNQLRKYMEPIRRQDALPGDALHFYFLKQPQHIAMLLPKHYILHADQTVITGANSKGKIVKHIIDDWWWSRVVGAYRFRRLEEWPNLLSV